MRRDVAAALLAVGVGLAVFGWTEWRTFSSERIAFVIAEYKEIDNIMSSLLEDHKDPQRARVRYLKAARFRGQMLLAGGCAVATLGLSGLIRRPQ